MCLQAPSGAMLQGLETTCSSSAGDSHRKGLPGAGAVPVWHSGDFCLLAGCREGRKQSWDPEEHITAMTALAGTAMAASISVGREASLL